MTPIGTGGATAASGGAASGGATAASGGATTSGGASSGGAASGGAASGGAASGGDTGAGGDTMSGGSDGAGGGTDTGGTDGAGGGEGGVFTLTSNELTEGGAYPDAHTCASGQGFGLPPSLMWSGAPEGTLSYALTMIDITLADGGERPDPHLGCHSAFWSLPASVTSLPAGNWSEVVPDSNSINGGYLGPCPSGNLDIYEITLYAFDTETIPSPGNMMSIDACNMLRDTLDENSTAKVVLSGTSDASF